ncbi:hypothetical protein LX36DRAFT_181245 [Colletotrichum falcatum]|nr:hypothetical protein LX36DRAFT_181245 [Colletotrichum falcatum]
MLQDSRAKAMVTKLSLPGRNQGLEPPLLSWFHGPPRSIQRWETLPNAINTMLVEGDMKPASNDDGSVPVRLDQELGEGGDAIPPPYGVSRETGGALVVPLSAVCRLRGVSRSAPAWDAVEAPLGQVHAFPPSPRDLEDDGALQGPRARESRPHGEGTRMRNGRWRRGGKGALWAGARGAILKGATPGGRGEAWQLVSGAARGFFPETWALGAADVGSGRQGGGRAVEVWPGDGGTAQGQSGDPD